ncbi:MAG: cyclic nucleotide-binding/CBS domain-containing protein [Halobacteriales archaeon]|jgi:CBS domain-containing protein
MGSRNPTPVRDVMSSPLETVSADATLKEAARAMREADVSALFVIAGTPAIVTTTDVVNAVAEGADLSERRVADVMTSPVESVPPDVSVQEAAAMMTSLELKHLPVTTDSVHGDDYVGMVSSTDVTEQFA